MGWEQLFPSAKTGTDTRPGLQSPVLKAAGTFPRVRRSAGEVVVIATDQSLHGSRESSLLFRQTHKLQQKLFPLIHLINPLIWIAMSLDLQMGP